jgi:hypothetical protein
MIPDTRRRLGLPATHETLEERAARTGGRIVLFHSTGEVLAVRDADGRLRRAGELATKRAQGDASGTARGE